MFEQKTELFSLIEKNYNLQITDYRIAERGYVAETFIITDSNGQEYFVKITDKPLFKEQIIKSLSILDNMHKNNIERICYPITSNKGLYFYFDNFLIVLFNHIKAKQSYDYSIKAFGGLIGYIHHSSQIIPIQTTMKESFNPEKAKETFISFKKLLNLETEDEFINKFISISKPHIKEIEEYINCFLNISKKCHKNKDNYNYVITHNDAGGNVLVKDKEDLYLIDWDDIMFAPAERDTWIMAKDEDFMKGYKSLNPNYSLNRDLQRYYTYKYFFNCLNYILADIVRTDLPDKERQSIIDVYAKDSFSKTNWFYPYLQDALKENSKGDIIIKTTEHSNSL